MPGEKLTRRFRSAKRQFYDRAFLCGNLKCLAAGHWLPDAVSLRSVFYEVVGQKEFTQATRIGWFSMQKSDLKFPSKTHPRLGPEWLLGSSIFCTMAKR
jgi:hypothetical protein